jgi:hypothetical protein
MAGLQVEKLAGVAQDGFKLHQDQRLFIDPTLRGLKECEEVFASAFSMGVPVKPMNDAFGICAL